MMTYNKAKTLLGMGIIPCIIYKDGYIDYIVGHRASQGDYECKSVNDSYTWSYQFDQPDEELFNEGVWEVRK